jgi:hypothetical protein
MVLRERTLRLLQAHGVRSAVPKEKSHTDELGWTYGMPATVSLPHATGIGAVPLGHRETGNR